MLLEQELELPHLPSVTFEDDELDGEGGSQSEDPYGYGYWRRPDGWITHGQMNYSAMQSQTRKGMVALEKYGKFTLNPALRQNAQKVVIPQWIPRLRPYDRILELGGATEFPAAQVIAQNWHRDCHIEVYDYRADGTWQRRRRRITFPQLIGLDLTGHPCSTCGRMFNSAADMKTHRSVAHPEEGTLEHLAEMSRSLSAAIMSGQQQVSGGSELAGVFEQFATILQQQSQTLDALMRDRKPAPARKRIRNRTPGPAPRGAPEVEPGENSGTEEQGIIR